MDEHTRLRGLLGTAAPKLAKARGLETVGDLLAFWPRRYRNREADLANLQVGDHAVVVADVKTANAHRMMGRKGTKLDVVITDGEQELDVTFFTMRGPQSKIQVGERYVWSGKVSEYRHRLQLAHPEIEPLPSWVDPSGIRTEGLVPIYLPVKGMGNWAVIECVDLVLGQLDELADPLPEVLRARLGLPGRLDAVRAMHQPHDWAEQKAAQERLRYEEAFVLQAVLARRRLEQAGETTQGRHPREGGLLAAFDARLPFELTAGQVEVGRVLAEEMARDTPMHRLLQGEVGSGKTVIALRAMLAAVDAGGQAALLAPTEVLAAQHHRSITAMLGDLAEGGMLGGSDVGTRVALLTGSQSTAARKQALLDTASGDAGIVVGTHALIQEHVSFHDLALVVVDEQHRFGVEQRDALREKGKQPPHVLVMTATPIPRTVAMTVFGDMETSTLSELPRGRSPISTHVVPGDRPRWVERTWERIAEEVRSGRQAYVVCPRIGDTDEAPDDGEPFLPPDDEGEPGSQPREWASVYAVEQALRATPALEGVTIEVLHGRMPAEDKDAVMARFTRGQTDVLVSTTVIEVGVDVPNATVMVVMDADRFGVSQLHQLRGRVGRGSHAGLCLLVTGTDAPAARSRLDAVAATTDGFELARLDLEQRREGDVLGARQSGGRSQLEFLSILRDERLIEQAREDAFALVADDPELAHHPGLAAAVAARVDEEQAAFLERG